MLLHLYTKLCRVLLFLVLVVVECEFSFLRIPLGEGRIQLVALRAF